MNNKNNFGTFTAFIVALGGFLMGFDASVISGVVKFIEPEFALSKIELGWAVASLALTASLGMLVAGPLSDKLGRIPVLKITALLFAVSAIASAMASSFTAFVVARMIGGLGVGAALIIAPMYIAEMSSANNRGRLVSLNQLNIVIGISVAFFSNYLILKLGQSQAGWAQALQFDAYNWRWMLGLETVPAVLYFVGLHFVPESPRWLIMQDRKSEAFDVMVKVSDFDQAKAEMAQIVASMELAKVKSAANDQEINDPTKNSKVIGKVSILELFSKPMRLVLMIGLTVAIVQQITGINAVFFYAPMIFEQSGIGTDAAFMQAILVGLTNLVFTVMAMAMIDKVGRKPLLIFGLLGIAVFMFLLAYGFSQATYTLSLEAIEGLSHSINKIPIAVLQDVTFYSDMDFKLAIAATLGDDSLRQFETELITAAISMNSNLILICILGFVASFAISLGPVMWVLFSELFPNRIRALAIAFVGLNNSAVSFGVQLVFPWELATIGTVATFIIYGVFAVVGLILIVVMLPETKGKSLEEIESLLVHKKSETMTNKLKIPPGTTNHSQG